MISDRCFLCRVHAVLFCLAVTIGLVLGHPLSRKLQLINESGERLAIDWIHPTTGEAVPMDLTGDGETFVVDSFVNHTFKVRSLSQTNHMTTITVSDDSNEQTLIVAPDLEVERFNLSGNSLNSESKSRSHQMSLSSRCTKTYKGQLAMGSHHETILNDLIECMEASAAVLIERQNEELAFQSKLLKSISAVAENYTCADHNMETSKPQEVKTWNYNGNLYEVGILHNRPSSQIHLLKNFISDEECEVIKTAASSKLHRGTVADGKGGSRMSENRKAWQAGIDVNDYNGTGVNPILAVKERLFAYANHVGGYNMSLPGQEDIMSIQYFGEGIDNPTPDRYTPHCDGTCDGTPHKSGGRVATIVMYCDEPELGGATNFQAANVYVKPAKNNAAFFSYLNPFTYKHETGFTTHSGCPVLLGTKRIAVQWMRIGVDAENPWDSFDTNTVSKKTYED